MKTKLLFIALSCLLFFAAAGQTQNGIKASASDPEQAALDANAESFNPFVQVVITQDGVKKVVDVSKISEDDLADYFDFFGISLKGIAKKTLSNFWHEGFLAVSSHAGSWGWIETPEFRTALGISDKQLQKIKHAHMDPTVEKCPELQEMQETQQAYTTQMRQFQKSGGLDNPDEETINKLFELYEKAGSAFLHFVIHAGENALTPEQRQKINEICLATMGKMSIISSRAFEALDLTDAQRKEIERIKKEIEPEFEKYREDTVNNLMILMEKMSSVFDTLDGELEVEISNALITRLIEKDPECRKIRDKMQSRSKAFATLFKTHVVNVLTDEQRKHLQELIDNPPKHAQIFLNMVRENMVSEWIGM